LDAGAKVGRKTHTAKPVAKKSGGGCGIRFFLRTFASGFG